MSDSRSPDAEHIVAGKYRIVRQLGEGGMGSVFEAENTWTGRRVALKILRRDLADTAGLVDRFLQEGRSAAMIAHPNIVDVLDMGQDPVDKSLYMVQEFLSGTSLEKLLQNQQQLPLKDTLDIVVPIMGGLAAAHKRAVVHRDIKPENIFLAQRHGRTIPKLIDFGVAKLLLRGKRNTSPGMLVGTPQYMAPEQIAGTSTIDARADIWSIATLIYELVSGRCPFVAANLPELCAMICTSDPPRLEQLTSDVPADFGRVIHRGLRRDPNERYPDMGVFLRAIIGCDALGEAGRWLAERHRDAIPYHREHERFNVQWSCTLRCDDWETARKLAVANVSRGGLFLSTRRPPAVGSNVTVGLVLPNGSDLRLNGSVLRVVARETASGGNRPGIAVRFAAEHSIDLQVLEQVAAAHQEPGFESLPEIDATALRPPGGAAAVSAAEAEEAARETQATTRKVGRRALAEQVEAKEAAEGEKEEARQVELPPIATPRTQTVPEKPARIAEAVGIDFGTSYGSIAIAFNDKVYPIPDHKRRALHPSIVAYPERGQPVVGWEARIQQLRDPKRAITSVKRVLGRSYEDRHLQGYLHGLPNTFLKGPNDLVIFEIDGNEIAPVQVAAEFIEYLKRIAESRTGQTLTKVVMSVPLAFDLAQRGAIRRAAEMGGLEVLELIEEPIAAVLAYGFGQGRSELVAVYDFGGGTFDFSILELSGNNHRVLASGGDAWLGGDDFDMAIAQDAANVFWRETKVDLRLRSVEWQRLLFSCEHAKRILSSEEQAEINLEQAIEHPQRIDLNQTLTRPDLQRLCDEAFQRSMDVCKQALSDAGLLPDRVDRVVITGGTSRIPFIQQGLSSFFGKEVTTTVDPELAVCIGTGLRAAVLTKHDVVEAARRGTTNAG